MKERRSVNKREVVDVSVSLAWYGSVTTEATHASNHTYNVSFDQKKKKIRRKFLTAVRILHWSSGTSAVRIGALLFNIFPANLLQYQFNIRLLKVLTLDLQIRLFHRSQSFRF